MHAFVQNQGDAWTVTSNYLDRFIDEQRFLATTDAIGESDEQVSYQRYMTADRQTDSRNAVGAGEP